MRLRGYIAARSKVRGVDIHSQLRMIFIIATHQLNTRTTNPLPILPLPYTVLLTTLYRPLSFTHHRPIVLSPLISHNTIPTHHIPLYYPIYPQKHTLHSNYIYPQSEFFVIKCLYFLIDKYLKLSYNKIKGQQVLLIKYEGDLI